MRNKICMGALTPAIAILLTIGRVENTRIASVAGRASAQGAQNAAATVPDDLKRMVEEAATAANTRHPAALAPFCDGDPAQRFAWTKETTSRWQAGVLAVPTAPNANAPQSPEYLAVFYAWHTCESDGDHVHRLVHAPQGWRLGAELLETDPGGFRVRDHDLHVQVDVPQHLATIRDHVRIERTTPDLPSFGLLRLSSDFHVQRLARDEPDPKSNRQPPQTEIPFQQIGGVIAFVPPAEKTFVLAMQYAGIVNHQGSDYIRANEATFNSYWYPHIARLPATATVTVVAPPGWTPIAQGESVRSSKDSAPAGSVPDSESVITATFRNSIPTCFFTLDMGSYTITTRQVKGRTLAAYLLASSPNLANRCLDLLERALNFYEASFGAFPYTRYAVVETQGPFGGALEAYSFATFGPGSLPFTLVHELAHTWWGGLVPCTYTRSMWDESFADYSENLFNRLGRDEKRPSRPTRAPRQRRNAAHAFDAFSLTQAHDTSDNLQSAVGYGKGSLVLRVLEEQIGQATMLRCLKSFVSEHPRGEAAEWPDFEKIVEKVTGKDYRWFFAQWTERTGLPVVTLAGVKTQRTGGETRIEGDIVQEGVPYRLRVQVQLEVQGGSAITQIVDAQGPRTHISLRTKASPVRLTLDPDGVLPLIPPARTPPNVDALSYEFPQDVGLYSVPGHPAATPPDRWARTPSTCQGASGPGSSGPGAPDLAAFLNQVAIAVNRKDRNGFAALNDPEAKNDTEWLVGQSALAPNDAVNVKPWRALPLALPATERPQKLIVLTKYHPAESRGDHVYALTQKDGQWRLGHEYAEADAIGYRLRTHRAHITLNPTDGTLYAVDQFTVTTDRETVALPVPGLLLLRLEDGYHVDSLQLGKQKVWYRQAGGILAVQMPPLPSGPDVENFVGPRGQGEPAALAQGAATAGGAAGKAAEVEEPIATFDIVYHGKAAQNSEDFITPKESALSGYWLPHIGRQPTTYDLSLTVPRGWSAFTQGVWSGKTVTPDGKKVTVSYHNTLPISFPSLAAGPFRLLSLTSVHGDPFSISVAYLHDVDKGLARRCWQTAQAALHFYHTHFAPFPYPHYTVVLSDRFGMALEGYSMTTVAHSYAPSVLPHEISHTWWGGILPNTYLRDLWNESFAEYSDGLYTRMTKRDDGMHVQEERDLLRSGLLATNLMAQLGAVPMRQASDALDIKHGFVGYTKGSLVLEMLEQMLGPEKMLDCIHAFLAARRPGETATWDDFQNAVTTTAGAEWKGFFDVWLDSKSVPTLRLENVQVAEKEGGLEVTAEIAQAGDTAYWLNVPLLLRLRNGKNQEIAVAVKSARTPVKFTLPAKADPWTLDIDPQRTLLRTPNPSGSIYRFHSKETKTPASVRLSPGGPAASPSEEK